MIALLVSLLSPAHAACPEPTRPAELRGHVDDALLSFATLDEEGFIASSDALFASVPCADAVLLSADAASIHRVAGLRAFWDGDTDAATSAFRAALRLEPEAALSNKIAPEGGPLYRLYEEAKSRPSGGMSRFSVPSWTTAYVDGTEASERPADVPAIVQLEASGGEVLWTALVPPGGPIPDSQEAARAERARLGGGPAPASEPPVADLDEGPEPVAPPADPVPSARTPSGRIDPRDAVEEVAGRLPVDVPVERVPRVPAPRSSGGGGGGKGGLVAATVATGVVSAGLFGTAVLTRQSFDENPTAAKFHITNGAYYGSIGTAALAGGLMIFTITK